MARYSGRGVCERANKTAIKGVCSDEYFTKERSIGPVDGSFLV